MSVRNYTDVYREVIAANHYNKRFINGAVDAQLVNNVVFNYAHTRRNQLGIMHNVNLAPTGGFDPGAESSGGLRLPSIYIGGRITPGIPLQIRILYVTAAAAEGDGIRCDVTLNGWGDTANLHGNSKTWAELEVPVYDYLKDVDKLEIQFRRKAGVSNLLYIYCICAFQESVADGLTYVDLQTTWNHLADNDYPDSARLRQLLRNGNEIIRSRKSPRANVFSHWYTGNYTNAAVAGISETGGQYRFVKRSGMTELKCHTNGMHDGGGNQTVSVHIKTTAGVDITNSPQNITFTAATPQWQTATFALVGTEQNDQEYELTFEEPGGAGGGGNTAYINGFTLKETPGSAVTHTVPDVVDALSGTPLTASMIDNIRDTLTHLYEVGGAEICCSDWRVAGTWGSITNTLTCDTNDVGAVWETQMDKTDANINSDCSVIGRCILFPSTSTKQIVFNLGYITTTGATRYKYLNFQITDNESSGVANFQDIECTDPNTENTGSSSTYLVMSNCKRFLDPNVYQIRYYQAELTIDSNFWETLNGGSGNPYQCYIMGACEDPGTPSEYIKPITCMVHEKTLGFGDFP